MKVNKARIVAFMQRFNENFNNGIIKNNKQRLVSLLKLYYSLDIILSFIIHGSHMDDYFLYEFYRKSFSERKTFVTPRKANLIYTVTEQKYKNILKGKLTTILTYNEYFKRDWLDPSNSDFGAFELFCSKHPSFLLKPQYGSSGKGIELINIYDYEDLHTLYKSIKNGLCILEEIIEQHPKMASLHPSSLNTLRVTTILKEGKATIVGSILRIGNNNSVVDNRSAGGIVANVDVKTGVVKTIGIESRRNEYVYHPITGTQIVGFNIPMWDEVLVTVKNIAKKVPEIKYAGWDIGISTKGPVLVEGNSCGAMPIQQQVDQIGKWPVYKEWLYQMRKSR